MVSFCLPLFLRALAASLSAFLAVSLFSPGTVRAQGQDYSKGFDLLFQLGLPDLSDWDYVKPGGNFYGQSRLSQFVQSGDLEVGAWLEPADDDGEFRRFSIDGVSFLATIEGEFDTQEAYFESYRRAAAAGIDPSALRDMGEAGLADEKADAEALVEAIDKALSEESSSRRILRDPSLLSELFFRAAHWHRRGLPEPATKLIDALFSQLPRKASLIEVAVNRIANQRLATALSQFSGAGDWKALETELQALLEDFPGYWQERVLVERLLIQVSPRVEGEIAAMEGTADFPLSEEEKKWWSEVTDFRPSGDTLNPYQSSVEQLNQLAWLWSRDQLPWPEDGDQSTEEQYYRDTMVEGAIFDPNRDWDWLKVMAAGLGDETLTTLSSNRMGRNFMPSFRRDLDSEPEELSEEELEERWRSLPRPMTRGELARVFLDAALPQPEPDEYQWWITAELNEARLQAKQWREKLAAADGKERIDLYLAEGDDQQKQWAATALARIGNEEDLKRLEELTLTTPREALPIATEIVKRRRDAGADYLAKFSAKLREEIMTENARYREDASKEELEQEFQSYYGSQLKALEAIVSGKGFQEMLASYLSGESDTQQFSSEVQTLQEHDWTREEAEAALQGLLKLETDQAQERAFLFNYAQHIARAVIAPEEQEADGPTPPATDSEEPPEDIPLPEWLVTALETLIAEGGELTIGNGYQSESTLARMAYYSADAMANAMASQSVMGALQGLPQESLWEYLEARGKARLAGEPVPDIPSAETVSEARRQEIVAGIEKVGTNDWREFVASLPVDEALMLRDALAEVEDQSGEAWQRASLTVGDIHLERVSEDRQPAWEELEGSVLDVAGLKEVLKICQDQAEGAELIGSISVLPLYTGLDLHIVQSSDSDDRDELAMIGSVYGYGPSLEDFRDEDAEPDFSAVAFIQLQSPTGSASIVRLLGNDGNWRHHQGDDPPPGFYSMPWQNPLADEDLDAKVGGFLEKFASPDNSPRNYRGAIRFGTAKIPADGEGEEDEEP